MNFEDFYSDYKSQLMQDLLTDEDIVKLIDEDYDLTNSINLAYKNVFPYEYVPETIEEAATYICFDVDMQKALNKTVLVPVVYVWVFTHKSLLRLSTGGVRTDKLMAKISGKLNGSRNYGIGTLDLNSVRRFVPLSDYQGKAMTFYTEEYNQISSTRKTPPSNRKKGV